jgi:hypothetical protein
LAALGFRVHSGWAALVGISGPLAAPGVIERSRVELADQNLAGSKQPYHAVEKLRLNEAEELLQRFRETSVSLAAKAVGECLSRLEAHGHKVVICGILLGSGRLLTSLEATLASHALIHTAEGEFFRKAVSDAATHHGLKVLGVKEKELIARCQKEFRVPHHSLDQHLVSIGRTLGPPWRQDEKLATQVAWLALATAKN